MKKISLLLFIVLVPSLAYSAAEFDMRKGVDLTSTNFIPPSLLNQLVDNGTISATNKGAIIRRSGLGGGFRPDVTLNPRYTNFLWLDMFTSPATLKSYVCCGDNYTNWVSASVAPQSITGDQILNFTIGDFKLATNSVNDYAIKASAVSGNKIADNGIIAGKLAPSAVILGNYAFGSIVGGNITNDTITHTNLADGAATRPKILSDAIDTTKITNGGVLTVDIGVTNITRDLILPNAIGPSQLTNGAVTTNAIAGDINKGLLNTNVSYNILSTWGLIDATTIKKGYNVSSVVSGTVGRYNIIFTTPYPDTNYAVVATPLLLNGANGVMCSFHSNLTTSVSIEFHSDAGTLTAVPFSFYVVGF